MIEFLVVAVIAVGALVAIGALAVLVLALKLIGWLLLWPFRVAVFFIFLPLLLLKCVFGLMLGLLVGVALLPMVAAALVLAPIVIMSTLLLPVLLVALLVWFVVPGCCARFRRPNLTSIGRVERVGLTSSPHSPTDGGHRVRRVPVIRGREAFLSTRVHRARTHQPHETGSPRRMAGR